MGIAGVFMNAITWIMKPILLITACTLVVTAAASQNPVPSYTNGAPAVPPYNGTSSLSPDGTSSITLPNAYPSSTGTYPINPGSTSPAGSNTAYPTSPGVPPQVNHIFPILFQDPMRNPKNPKTAGPVTTVDGSNGKYRSQHKFTPAKKNGFTSHRRTKGVKGPKRKVSREKGAQ
jgi:hypothetical protein